MSFDLELSGEYKMHMTQVQQLNNGDTFMKTIKNSYINNT